jgi:undecaprenyl pyrophosphate synthase
LLYPVDYIADCRNPTAVAEEVVEYNLTVEAVAEEVVEYNLTVEAVAEEVDILQDYLPD